MRRSVNFFLSIGGRGAVGTLMRSETTMFTALCIPFMVPILWFHPGRKISSLLRVKPRDCLRHPDNLLASSRTLPHASPSAQQLHPRVAVDISVIGNVPANHKKDRRKPSIRPITTSRGKHPRKEMMVSCIKLCILLHYNIINSRAKNYLAQSQSPFTIGPLSLPSRLNKKGVHRL
jgi:hypothetical protein